MTRWSHSFQEALEQNKGGSELCFKDAILTIPALVSDLKITGSSPYTVWCYVRVISHNFHSM